MNATICQHCNKRDSVATVRQHIDGRLEEWRICEECMGAVSEFADVIRDEDMRYALARKVFVRSVTPYLPRNYHASEHPDGVLISGADVAGWTLEDYVIPRLASGLIFAEVMPARPILESFDLESVDRDKALDDAGVAKSITVGDAMAHQLTAAVERFELAADGPSSDEEHSAALDLAETARAIAVRLSAGEEN